MKPQQIDITKLNDLMHKLANNFVMQLNKKNYPHGRAEAWNKLTELAGRDDFI